MLLVEQIVSTAFVRIILETLAMDRRNDNYEDLSEHSMDLSEDEDVPRKSRR